MNVSRFEGLRAMGREASASGPGLGRLRAAAAAAAAAAACVSCQTPTDTETPPVSDTFKWLEPRKKASTRLSMEQDDSFVISQAFQVSLPQEFWVMESADE